MARAIKGLTVYCRIQTMCVICDKGNIPINLFRPTNNTDELNSVHWLNLYHYISLSLWNYKAHYKYLIRAICYRWWHQKSFVASFKILKGSLLITTRTHTQEIIQMWVYFSLFLDYNFFYSFHINYYFLVLTLLRCTV